MKMKKRFIHALSAFLTAAALSVGITASVTEGAQSAAEAEPYNRILGDINGDGSVDISDVLGLFQHSMLPDLFPIDYPGSVDFDKNITVNISDVLRLFQHSMLPDLFPIEWGGEPYRPEGFDIHNLQAERFKASDGFRIPYRLYVPEDYDPSVSYPLVVYLHSELRSGTDNESPLSEAKKLFESPSSPVYRSIVLIPQCRLQYDWSGRVLEGLMELVDHINENYSTDFSRQYYTGSSDGANGIWRLMEQYPHRISAVVCQGAESVNFLKYPNGQQVTVGITDEMPEIPVCVAYDKHGGRGAAYYTLLSDTIADMGGTTLLTESYGSFHAGNLAFANEEDISVLEWLFRQNRAAGEDPGAPSVPVEPEGDIEYADFNVDEAFEWGEFQASNGITLPYRYYLPVDYDESREYPVLLFLHTNSQQGTDNKRPIQQIKPYFANAKSPVYQSIVVVPQCPPDYWWAGATIDAVAELTAFINSQFSTDLSRQYAAGISMGGDGTWELLGRYPQRISAAVPVAGSAWFYFTSNMDGTMSIEGLNPLMQEIPICYVYDINDQFYSPIYQRSVNRTIIDLFSDSCTYLETSAYGHDICYKHVSAEDISILEWLFAQRRETKQSQY